MKLIDKDKVVAEIEKRLDKMYNLLPDASKVENDIVTIPEACNTGKYMALESFRKFLDTLEVKEVDLEKKLKILDDTLFDLDGVAVKGATSYLTLTDVKDIAKHFYELGLKAQKGE